MALSSRLRLRLLAVLATCLFILSTLASLAYVVSNAIGSMALSADQMDDARALTATTGALSALKKQLGATVRDNAYWDDAYKSLNGDGAAEWATENWGATTEDYPLYDTALVINPDGSSLIAYHKGVSISDSDVDRFLLGNLGDVVAAARRSGITAENLSVGFVKTSSGVALIGAAAVQPSQEDATFDIRKAKVLVYSKQLTSSVVAEIAETFSIEGLLLTEAPGEPSILHADIVDIKGRKIASMTWPPIHPGTASYHRVRPAFLLSALVLLVLLGAVAACGFVVFRVLRNGERVANHKAKHDALTGLLNRAGCLERLEMALSIRSKSPATLHILDLDGFKPVNDAWGHLVGDRLIQDVADRLVASLPSTASVARLGGDEFAVIGDAPMLETDPSSLADFILAALKPPFNIDGRIIEIGGSVGSAQAEAGVTDSVELLRRADLALYRAKDLGRGVAVGFEPSLDEDAGRNSELEQELRHGIANKEIRVVFQPLVDASTREVTGVEALARWTSPTRGPVSPEIFIRVAEKAGLIDQLGFQVLRLAILEGVRWPGIGVAVNVSPLQLRNPDFCRQVRDILAKSGFDPARLTIEVTESALISNPDQAKRAFNGLREAAVKIALDDFGCGYASIGTLREFGFDSMKVDRSLVIGLHQDNNGGAILQATVALANALHLPVTAEGIETEEQATAVRLCGCDKLQGFLFSKPVTADEITAKYFAHLLVRSA
ncbi:putative bifunctional diguanylate cyclase/phosphodiesterase [Rhizobium sp. TRM95796]|uniref:putative bifunctional diguanylate cyclase/phosphodiesterase n=1 Tax=Rhizobium sp. TRM95796 TaxID=2979862 RepID=UPI0021E87695|nr:EAL domain-containing protein [Rhizobium sp. TRM95796]MCV3765126.1 EAL domain-containing protein [Rhizobium sp. TRM95796]